MFFVERSAITLMATLLQLVLQFIGLRLTISFLLAKVEVFVGDD
jgi:hypothetical protein